MISSNEVTGSIRSRYRLLGLLAGGLLALLFGGPIGLIAFCAIALLAGLALLGPSARGNS